MIVKPIVFSIPDQHPEAFTLLEFQGEFRFGANGPPSDCLELFPLGEGLYSLHLDQREELKGRIQPLATPLLVCKKSGDKVEVEKVVRSRILFTGRPTPLFKPPARVLTDAELTIQPDKNGKISFGALKA